MRIGSVCSGIGCEAVAWAPIEGWEHVFFSEVAAFPRAVLKHRFPDVPLHGDFTTIEAKTYGPIDLLVGGTPCQSFSVAGQRGGVDDHRGDLAFEFLALARRLRPKWIVWENVPGVLSIDGGRSFGAFLGAMAELGYGFAYRVLDAQYVRVDGYPRAVPQRRRRLFVVGCLGSWQRAAAVLLERQSLQGHPPPRRTQGQGAPTLPSRSSAGGGLGTDFDCDGGLVSQALSARPHASHREDSETYVTGPLTSCGDTERKHGHGWGQQEYENGFIVPTQAFGVGIGEDGDPMFTLQAGKQHAVAFSCKDNGGDALDGLAPTLRAMGHDGSHANAGGQVAVAFDTTQITHPENRSQPKEGVCHTLPNEAHAPAVAMPSAVRRLTPRECERLQGLPDDWTLIPWRGGLAADGPRYKAIGNGMAVNVVRWIGRRIELVEALTNPQQLIAAE